MPNYQTAYKMQAIGDEMDACVRNHLAGWTDEELIQISRALLLSDPEALRNEVIKIVLNHPHDTAAMIGWHFCRELFRRQEIKAMETDHE